MSSDIFEWIDAKSDDIDLLWVLAPPNTFVADAARIKQKHNRIRLIIDLIDLWPETMPVGKLKPMLHGWQMLRDKNLRYADTVITECNLYRKVLRRVLNGMDVYTLYLAREDKGYEPKLSLPEDTINLCYLGSINNIIDIDTIGEVIKSLRVSTQKNVRLVIIGDGEKKYEFIRKAEEAGAEVDFKGCIYGREEKQKVFDSCHYGLNIMKGSVCVGLTMKSIDYFEFGLPIINNIKGDTWSAIEKKHCGVNWKSSGGCIPTPDTKMRISARAFFEKYLTEDVFKKRIMTIVQ